jgi:hypothetical protein
MIRSNTSKRFRRCPLATAILVLTWLPSIAAAVNEPPVSPRVIVAFPERDFVSAEGFAPGEQVTFEVERRGVVIGTGTAVAGPDGIAEVNHPGGGCWSVTTPNIIPGDTVRTITAAVADQTTVANVTAGLPQQVGGDIVIHGTAQDANGSPLPIGSIDQRLINRDLFDNGKRRLSAPGDGTLTYDAPNSIDWTAKYRGLSSSDATKALGSETRILWLGANPLAGTELTIFEIGPGPGDVVGGPSPPCSAPLADNAVTSVDRKAVNLANVDKDLVVAGVAMPTATAVSVLLRSSGGGATIPVTTSLPGLGGATGQVWTATIPAGQVAALPDGALATVSTYTVNGVPLNGVDQSLPKDTSPPAAPTATPPPGRYTSMQWVLLTHADANPATQIRFTLDGSTPSIMSTLATAQIAITTDLTLRAGAIDPAGNVSAEASMPYEIRQPLLPPPRAFGPPVKRPLATATGRLKLKLGSMSKAGLTFKSVWLTDLAKGSSVNVRCIRGCTLARTWARTGAAIDLGPTLKKTRLSVGAAIEIRILHVGQAPRVLRLVVGKKLKLVVRLCSLTRAGVTTGCHPN